MLSKKDWVKKYVVRWQGIRNCDTHTVEGGYLFVRDDEALGDGVIGLGTRNVSSRAEAIAYHYDLYVEAQTNTACTGLAPTAAQDEQGSTGASQ